MPTLWSNRRRAGEAEAKTKLIVIVEWLVAGGDLCHAEGIDDFTEDLFHFRPPSIGSRGIEGK